MLTTQGLGAYVSNPESPYDRLVKALDLIGDPPCVSEKCPLYDTCAKQRLACMDFLYYTNGDRLAGDREPTAGIYQRIFKPENRKGAKVASLVESC